MKEVKTIKEPTEKISIPKTILSIFLSISILVIAQSLVITIGAVLLKLGVPGVIYNIAIGILYILFTFLGASLLCRKFLKIPMVKLRIPKVQLKPIWLISAVLMPLLVLLIFMLIGGHWETNTFNTETILATLTTDVVFYGLATGIVEEMIFRGLIMGCLEKRFHIKIAIIISSVLFGVVHISGRNLDFISIIQLLVAGSIVGMLFSLIAYESNSIWNNAAVHGFWNMSIVGGILHIGNKADHSSIYNFVFGKKQFLISGGDFGIEASIVSIFVYLIFVALAVFLLKKKKRSKA